MESMSVVQIYGYGGTDALVYGTAPRPTAGEGEVLIRIHATTVNPFDCAVRAGYMANWYNFAFPLIPGVDVSGVVEEIGAGVANVAVGDAVYTRTDPGRLGAYAEYITLPANQIAASPKSVGHVHAAALPHVTLTAWAALIATANLTAGQSILIHGAAGGVGHIAVQLAKWRGAKVVGTASDSHAAFLQELGVDQLINYRTTRFEDVVKDADLVLDTMAGETRARSWQVLKKGGILVSILGDAGFEQAGTYGVRAATFLVRPVAEQLEQLAKIAEAGQLKVAVDKVFPLAEAGAAHAYGELGHTRGKIVLQVV